MAWVFLTLTYGLLKGARDIVKKKAMGRSSVMEVLFTYTLISFIMVLPDAKNAMGLSAMGMLFTALKSLIIFIAWLCGFNALSRMPVSLYGVLDLTRILFSTLMGVCLLGETLGAAQIAGMALVMLGLVMLSRTRNASGGEKVSAKVLGLSLICCFLNSASGTMDKVLMRTMTSAQLQFWYMFFLTLYYALFLLIRREKINVRGVLTNGLIYLLSAIFVIGDRALFMANGIAESRVTVMQLIKQSGCIVSIIGGRLIFHEKGTLYKLCCAGVVLAGIAVSVLL